MGFFSNWFKGLQKEEQTNNDEYVEYLLKELEKAKTENAQALEKEKRLMAQIEAAQENQKDDADREKAELRAQVEAMREELEKNARRLEEGAWQKEKELKELKERLKEYESSYPQMSKYISQAKEDADAIRLSAKSESEEILLSAKTKSEEILASAKESSLKLEAETKAKTDLYRHKVEKKLRERARENEEKFNIARCQMKEYLDAFNRIQSSLVKNYNELGQWIEKMPIRIEDLFSDKPLELLSDREQEKSAGRTSE